MSKRRIMMLQGANEEIPRERLVFSKAGDIIADGVTKTNDGEAICGFAVIHQSYYPPTDPMGNKPYWLYLILMSKTGRDDNAVIASQFAKKQWKTFTDSNGIIHSISNTTWGCSLFNSVEDGINYINNINVNNLPIMNELTGKNYEGTNDAGGSFSCIEAAQDLLAYYNGEL